MTLTPLHVLQLRRQLDDRKFDTIDPRLLSSASEPAQRSPAAALPFSSCGAAAGSFDEGESWLEHIRRVAGDLRRSLEGFEDTNRDDRG